MSLSIKPYIFPNKQGGSQMKKLMVVSIAMIMGLMFVCSGVSHAEMKAGESIFEYKKELALTDKQEKNLRDILSKLQTYLTKKTEELNTLRADLNKMITEKADLSRIKVKLQSIASIQAAATYEDIASIRAIEKELTADQMAKWRGMQEEFRKNQQDAQAAKPEQKEGSK